MWTFKLNMFFFFQSLAHTAARFKLLGNGKLISLVGGNHDSALL